MPPPSASCVALASQSNHAAATSHLGGLASTLGLELHGAVQIEHDGPITRHRTADGVSSVYPLTGGLTATVAPDSAVMHGGYPGLTEHESLARQYFRALGVPDREVALAHTFTEYSTREALGREVRRDVLRDEGASGFVTALGRSVDGIPVPESIATVRFNATGQVINATLHWPNISERVVRRAKSLAGRVAGGRAPAAATNLASAQVAIHHNLMSDVRRWERATVRVMSQSGTQLFWLDFTAQGTPFFPSVGRPAPGGHSGDDDDDNDVDFD